MFAVIYRPCIHQAIVIYSTNYFGSSGQITAGVKFFILLCSLIYLPTLTQTYSRIQHTITISRHYCSQNNTLFINKVSFSAIFRPNEQAHGVLYRMMHTGIGNIICLLERAIIKKQTSLTVFSYQLVFTILTPLCSAHIVKYYIWQSALKYLQYLHERNLSPKLLEEFQGLNMKQIFALDYLSSRNASPYSSILPTSSHSLLYTLPLS